VLRNDPHTGCGSAIATGDALAFGDIPKRYRKVVQLFHE
jgi:hypothetical protein